MTLSFGRSLVEVHMEKFILLKNWILNKELINRWTQILLQQLLSFNKMAIMVEHSVLVNFTQ